MSLTKLFKVVSALTILALALGACGAPGGSKLVLITAGGATFPLPVYTEWTTMYQTVDPAVTINYQGIGSGGGKKGILDGTFDFAGSDSVLTDTDYLAATGVDLQMYPVLAGAVVPIYNIEGTTQSIVLSREGLAGIFLGKITKWNDPALTTLNPGIKFPDATITVVHRADGSGTTEIFTNALAAFSPEWQSQVGAGPAVEWPTDKLGSGLGGKGNQGVAGAIRNTKNSIGYVELNYATSNNIPFAQMINKAGKTVKADAAGLASAINDFAGAFDKRFNAVIVDGSGEGSWPIAGYTYLILHTKTISNCTKAQKIVEYIRWSLTDAGASKRAAELGYAVLPDAVRPKVLAKLAEVTCNGQPVLK